VTRRSGLGRRDVVAGSALASLAGAFAGPAAAQTAARRPGDGAVSVRDLGAKGDGQSDDSRAFARAVEAVSGTGGIIFVPPGNYRVSRLGSASGVWWQGVPGASVLRYSGGGELIRLNGVHGGTFTGLTFDGNNRAPLKASALVEVWKDSTGVSFENCTIQDSARHGLAAWEAGCEVRSCTVQRIADYGIRIDSELEVKLTGNTIRQIDNNGIRIERERPARVRVIVADNHIVDIAATHGGDGPNGNGINIFRAHDVVVRGNYISRCKFSALRSNLGHGVVFVGNHCSDCEETTVFIEFGATGAVIVGNTISDGGMTGIAVTNFDDDGRLASCVGNVVRNIKGYGIYVEADTLVQGNVVDGARCGIVAGQGAYLRNVTIDGNLIQDRRGRKSGGLAYGILVSNHTAAGPCFVTNNRIFDAAEKPVWGHAYQTPRPLGANLYLANNYPGIESRDLPAVALAGSSNHEPDTGLIKTYRAAGRRSGWRES
jgi:uncharacterized secreted repeat protein (TIGR03808 family)